jgi:hypothetical protein
VKLHFDEHLVDLAAQQALPRLVSWRILKLSNPQGMVPGSDPFKLMGLDPNLCKAPAESHESVLLKLSYLDAIRVPQTYLGPEGAFDWTQVSEVISISRDGQEVDPEGRGMIEIGTKSEGMLDIK